MGRDEIEVLVRSLDGLAPEALAEVRDFAEFLKARAGGEAPLVARAALDPLAPAVADSMALAIKEACEVVYPDDWSGMPGHERGGGDPPRS